MGSVGIGAIKRKRLWPFRLNCCLTHDSWGVSTCGISWNRFTHVQGRISRPRPSLVLAGMGTVGGLGRGEAKKD